MDPYQQAIFEVLEMAAAWPEEVREASGTDLLALMLTLISYVGHAPPPPPPPPPPAPVPVAKPK